MLQIQQTRVSVGIQHTQHRVVLGHLESGHLVLAVDRRVVTALVRIRSSRIGGEYSGGAAGRVHRGVGLGMGSFVSDLLGSLTETSAAELTLEGFQTCVNSLVLVEMRLLGESFGTKSASVRSLLKVDSVVLLKPSPSLESLSTLGALMASHLTAFISMAFYLKEQVLSSSTN